MTKKSLGIGISLVLIAVLWFTLKEKVNVTKLEKNSPQTATPTKPKKVDLSKGKLSDVLKNTKKTISKSKESSTKDDLTAKCQSDRLRLAELSLDEFRTKIEAGDFWFDIDCMELEPEAAQYWARLFYGACTKLGVQKTPELCSSYAFFMKAQILAEQVEGQSLDSLSDQELISVFYSQFLQPKMKSVVEELTRRFPNSPGVAKAAVVASVQGLQDHADVVAALGENLDRAKALNPSDPDLLALDMYLAVENNEEGVDSSLQEYNSQYTDSGEGYYALAYKAWKSGNRQQAQQYLDQAIQREPSNKRYRETKDKVKTAKQKDKVFGISLGFRPEDF